MVATWISCQAWNFTSVTTFKGHGQQDQQLLQQQQQQLGQLQDTGGTHQLQKVQLLNSGGILQLQIDQTGQIGQILLQKGQICGNKSLFHSNLKL